MIASYNAIIFVFIIAQDEAKEENEKKKMVAHPGHHSFFIVRLYWCNVLVATKASDKSNVCHVSRVWYFFATWLSNSRH